MSDSIFENLDSEIMLQSNKSKNKLFVQQNIGDLRKYILEKGISKKALYTALHSKGYITCSYTQFLEHLHNIDPSLKKWGTPQSQASIENDEYEKLLLENKMLRQKIKEKDIIINRLKNITKQESNITLEKNTSPISNETNEGRYS